MEVSDPEWTTEPKSTGPGEYKPAIKARNCCITKGKDLTVTCTNTVEKEIKHENSLTTTTANTFESSTSLSAGVSAPLTLLQFAWHISLGLVVTCHLYVLWLSQTPVQTLCDHWLCLLA